MPYLLSSNTRIILHGLRVWVRRKLDPFGFFARQRYFQRAFPSCLNLRLWFFIEETVASLRNDLWFRLKLEILMNLRFGFKLEEVTAAAAAGAATA